jgi:hypothetical protein
MRLFNWKSIGLIIFSAFASLIAETPVAAQSGYSYVRTITIDHTKVPNTDQSNFPVLISGTYSYLATTGNGGNVTSSSGYDIIFTSDSAGSSVLPFERESYNASTGAVTFWIQIPTVSHTSDTVIYMFYGNSSVTTDQSNKNGVWDSNFKAVYHLPNGTTLSGSDSTSNANNMSINGATATTGEIAGGGAAFNGSNESLGESGFNLGASNVTVSAWVYSTNFDQNAVIVNKEPTNDDWVFFLESGYLKLRGVDTATLATTGLPSNSAWHYLVGTISGTSGKIYVDGVLQTSGTIAATTDTTNTLDIGRYGDDGGGYYFNGSMDEVEVSDSVRSSDWISTAYGNQSSPSTFYSVGSAMSGSGPNIISLSPTAGPVGGSIMISGINFGSTGTVTFNGTAATPTAWSTTSIVVPVPSGATTGNVVVTVGSVASNGVSFTVTSGSGGWTNSYTYRRAITINHTKVPNTNQTDFPVLISGTYSYLATTGNGGDVTNSNGYDIIFTSDSTGSTALPFERESYNASTGAVSFWVQVPTVSDTSDTVIYMFYGNSSVTTDQSNKTGVWSSNYEAVWHLDETSGTVNYDSTSNNINANKNSSTSPSPAAGLFGEVQSFNGSSDYDAVTNTSAIEVGGGNHTVSVWFQANSYASLGDTLFTKEASPSIHTRIIKGTL